MFENFFQVNKAFGTLAALLSTNDRHETAELKHLWERKFNEQLIHKINRRFQFTFCFGSFVASERTVIRAYRQVGTKHQRSSSLNFERSEYALSTHSGISTYDF